MTFCLDSFHNGEIHQILYRDLATTVLADSMVPFACFTNQEHRRAFFFWGSCIDFLPCWILSLSWYNQTSLWGSQNPFVMSSWVTLKFLQSIISLSPLVQCKYKISSQFLLPGSVFVCIPSQICPRSEHGTHLKKTVLWHVFSPNFLKFRMTKIVAEIPLNSIGI